MDRTLKITLLGNVALTVYGQPTPKFRSRKALALFIYLICTQTDHARETLADLLWDATSSQQSLSNLRTVLSMLRPHLGNYLHVSPNRLGIAYGHEINADYWQVHSGLRHLPSQLDEESANHLQMVLSLYRGGFLANFDLEDAPRFNEWVEQERLTLHNRVIAAYHHLANYQKDSEQYLVGINNTSQWLQIDPMNEAAHAMLMKFLAETGRRHAALAQYHRCRTLLWQELGVEPEDEIQQLYYEIGGR